MLLHFTICGTKKSWLHKVHFRCTNYSAIETSSCKDREEILCATKIAIGHENTARWFTFVLQNFARRVKDREERLCATKHVIGRDNTPRRFTFVIQNFRNETVVCVSKLCATT